jgi:hypothetical protein
VPKINENWNRYQKSPNTPDEKIKETNNQNFVGED